MRSMVSSAGLQRRVSLWGQRSSAPAKSMHAHRQIRPSPRVLVRACQQQTTTTTTPTSVSEALAEPYNLDMSFKNVNNARTKRDGNVDGTFWVDATCIYCDTCRTMTPTVFKHLDGGSITYHQPESHEESVAAARALLSCPTFSIHAEKLPKEQLKEAQRTLPLPIPNCPGVFHCGWHSVSSLAAFTYLIQRPKERGGNILVDTPRYNPILAKRLEEMGGVSYMFLTHKDDAGEHEKWANHFGSKRLMHEGDAGSSNPVTGNKYDMIETVLKGAGPWDVDGNTVEAREDGGNSDLDVMLIHTPGHTRGCLSLYYKPGKALFTGDHLCADMEKKTEAVAIFEDVNWYSVPEQLRSVAKLLQYDFLHVLPGHGRRIQFRDAGHREKAIRDLLKQHGYQEELKA